TTLVVFDQNGDKYELLDRLTGAVRLTVPAHQAKGEFFFSDWAGDSVLFAVTTGGGSELLDAVRSDGTGERVVAQEDHGINAASSPDGTWIAYPSASPPNGESLLHLVRPDGTDDRVLANVGELLAWSPNGSQIAVVSPEHRVAFLALDGTAR